MDKIYLNEMSLDGQFSSMNAFIDSCDPMIKCLNYLKKQNEKVYKHSTFYKQKITQEKTFNDLRGAKGDKARKLKILLLSTTDNPPFWDEEDHFAQDLELLWQRRQKNRECYCLFRMINIETVKWL